MVSKTVIKGKIAELRFAAELLKLGHEVYIPVNDSSPVDLIGEKDSVFTRYQVKYITPNNGVLRVHMKSNPGRNRTRRPYKEQAVDNIAIYDSLNDRGYVVPIGNYRSEMLLRLIPTRNNQRKGIHYAADYRIF